MIGRFATVEPAGGRVGGLLNPPLEADVRDVEVAGGFVADDEVEAVGARRTAAGAAVVEVRLAAAEDDAALGVVAISASAMMV